MIKVIGVFDKVLKLKIREESLVDFIVDEISNMDITQLPCPVCGGKNPIWKYLRSNNHRFIWDYPNSLVHVTMPQYSYYCDICNTRGIERVSTDLTIDRTQLSYHYLFSLLFLKKHSSGVAILDLDNTLYARLSEESLYRWTQRYRSDYLILQSLFPGLAEEDVLLERISFEALFVRFYENEHRFFLQDSSKINFFHVNSRNLSKMVTNFTAPDSR